MKVLFFAFNNDTQLKVFLPVMQFLMERRWAEPVLVSGSELKGFPTERRLLTSLSIPHEVLDSRLNCHRISQLFRSVTVGRKRISKLLHVHRPAVVVMGNDHAVPHNYLLDEARRMQIPSLLVQDGVMRSTPAVPPLLKRLGKSFAGIPLSYGQGGCTRIAAWGPAVRNYFLAAGVPSDRIEVVGCPRFDEILLNPPSPTDLDGLLPPAPKRILYLSSAEAKFGIYSPEEQKISRLAMLRAPRALEQACHGVRLVIKLHREDDLQAANELVRASGEAGTCTLLQNEVELYSLLPACDVVVTHYSTAGLEALLFSRPLIIFNPTGRPDVINYVAGDAALPARTERELHSTLRDILTCPRVSAQLLEKGKHYLASQVGPLDGRASERVALSILGLAGFLQRHATASAPLSSAGEARIGGKCQLV